MIAAGGRGRISAHALGTSHSTARARYGGTVYGLSKEEMEVRHHGSPYKPLALREHLRAQRFRLSHHDLRAFTSSVSPKLNILANFLLLIHVLRIVASTAGVCCVQNTPGGIPGRVDRRSHRRPQTHGRRSLAHLHHKLEFPSIPSSDNPGCDYDSNLFHATI